MKLTKRVFGQYENKKVYEYTLTNENNLSLSAIPFGATVTKLVVPDKDGKRENVILSIESLDDIVNSRSFYGATVGRVAGRIRNGSFNLDDKTYYLDTNEKKNTLHGGPQGLDTKLWEVSTDEKNGKLFFTCESQALENGFPGTLAVTVTFTLTEENDWMIDYEATTDESTLFNPTNHVYFNLMGNSHTSILEHELELASAQYVPLDQENLPKGHKNNVLGTPFDFQKAKPLKEAVLSDHEQIRPLKGLDHPFVLNQGKGIKGKLYEPKSGREVTLYTDRNSLVIFTHNGESKNLMIKGEPVKQYAGIALETQTLPDAINNKDFGNSVLRPEETFHSKTVYHFGIRDQTRHEYIHAHQGESLWQL